MCTVTEFQSDLISSLYKDSIGHKTCETECKRYSWCKGIRVSATSEAYACGLLAQQNLKSINFELLLAGWRWINTENWVEPDQWKNGREIQDSTAGCYEKIITGIGMYIKKAFLKHNIRRGPIYHHAVK